MHHYQVSMFNQQSKVNDRKILYSIWNKISEYKHQGQLHFVNSSSMITANGRYTYDVHENCSVFKIPHIPCLAASKILPPPWPWTSSLKWKHNPGMTVISYLIRSFLQVGFCFQYQLINLVWVSIDFFSISWSQPRSQSN